MNIKIKPISFLFITREDQKNTTKLCVLKPSIVRIVSIVSKFWLLNRMRLTVWVLSVRLLLVSVRRMFPRWNLIVTEK